MRGDFVVAAFVIALVGWSAGAGVAAHDSGLAVVRYHVDGSLDGGFGRGGVVAERTVQGGLSPEALVIQADGKIVLAGTASDLATAAVGFGLARYNPDGTLDSGFGTGGRVLTRVGAATAEAHAVALQSDGAILVAGGGFPRASDPSNLAVARYTPGGSLDPGFAHGVVLTSLAASGAEARAIVVQSDGRIVVAGTAFASGTTSDALVLARYNADGSLDPSFGSGGSVMTSFDGRGAEAGSSPFRTAALVIQSDGRLVAVGSIGGHQGAFALARFLPSGVLDPAFGSAGIAITQRESSTQAYAAAVQSDGKIVVGGGLGGASDSVAFVLARYGPNGDLDPGFGAGGFVTTAFEGGGSGAHGVTIGTDGSVVAVGQGYAASAGQGAVSGGFAVVRYRPNGTVEPAFGRGGVALTTVGDAGSMPAAVGVEPDGKLVAAGLTYFLVPTPSADGFNPADPLFMAALVIVLVAIVVRRRRRRALRSAGSQIGPAPGASRSPR